MSHSPSEPLALEPSTPSNEWATRARFEQIKAKMPAGVPGYSAAGFDWMHDALRELIDYCANLQCDLRGSHHPT